MAFLTLDETQNTNTSLRATLLRLLKALGPRAAKIDGEAAARQAVLRDEARAAVDRLLH